MAEDRPQDVGRSHKAKGAPSPATVSLLGRYHDSMRSELSAILDELEPRAPEPGLIPDVPAEPRRLPVKDRAGLWDLAIKLGRELGSAIEPGPEPTGGAAPRAPRKRRVDYGGA